MAFKPFKFVSNLFGGGGRSSSPAPQSVAPAPQSRAPSGGFTPDPRLNFTPASPVTPGQGFSSGQILGASTQQPPGGGGGGQSQPGGDGGGQPPLEQAPEPAQIDFDALIAPGLEALSQAEQAIQSVFGAGEAEIEAGRTSAIEQAELTRRQGEEQVGAAQTRAGQAAESADVQQRRGLAEVTKNLLGRFGRSGFGQGIIGETSSQVLRNIADIKTNLSNVMQDLETRKAAVNSIADQAIREAGRTFDVLKQRAKADLESSLAQIGQARGELQSRKAERVFQAVENYRSQVQDVNARNTAFQQQIFLQKQSTDEAIRLAQSRAQNISSHLPSFELSPGQTKFLPLDKLGGEGAFAGLSGTQLPGGAEFGTAGPYGVFSSPEEDKNKNGPPGGDEVF